jgi:hypothetical protein
MTAPRASAPRQRTHRRADHSRGTCRDWRRRATAAPCRRAAPRADQHCLPDLAPKRRGQRREVLPLALAAGDHHQRPFHSGHRGQSGAHVGALRVIHVPHPGDIGDPGGPVRQPGKGFERVQHGGQRQPRRIAQCQRRQGVGGVVKTRDFQAREIEHGLAMARQQGLRPPAHQGIVSGTLSGKRHGRTRRRAACVAAHRRHPRVIGVQHHRGGASENSRLGAGIVLDGGVAVHVVSRDVQYHRGREIERRRALQLEARQLQHVQVRHGLVQQIERGFAEIASGEHTAPRGARHAGDQAGDGALAVGARDADHRRAHGACEQFHVSQYFDAARPCFFRNGLIERQAGGHQHLRRAVEQRQVDAP